MTIAAKRPPVYIESVEDAELDDPDTDLIEALRDSDKPERVFRARRMALQKLAVLERRLKRRSEPPSR